MSKTLKERLEQAKVDMDKVIFALDRQPRAIPDAVAEQFRNFTTHQQDIAHCLSLIDARLAAWQLISDLETKGDENRLFPLGDARIEFVHVRLIAVQAYLGLTWALADRIAGLAGQILCTSEAGANKAKPPQLVSHFIMREKAKKTIPSFLFESVQKSYGWPVGISYALRNHFVHDGAQLENTNFFEASTADSGFKINEQGWTRIENKANEQYRVNPSFLRPEQVWPSDPRADLREVLRVCESEMDEALGVILGTACKTLLIHVGFMLGED